MDFRLLGPLEVCDGQGAVLPLGGAKQRAVLAILLLNANQVVPTDRLIDELWDEEPPETATNVLQVYIGQLRKVLQPQRPRRSPDELIVTRPSGYLLRVGPDELDLERCRRLLEQARAAMSTDPEAAAQLLREALGLWRGQPLADVVFASAEGEAGRLEELRFTALESRIQADLARGAHVELVGELEALATRHPLRERLRAHWMLALYRSGRQAEALAVYRETQRVLSEELGIDPGSELQHLELAILRHDPTLAAPQVEVHLPARPEGAPTPAGATPPALTAPREERKVVTVLLADLVRVNTGSEQPDPEDVRQLLSPHNARLRAELERSGGTVQTFIGDSVMALFGAPLAHEDDPERAVRAALAIRAWVFAAKQFQVMVAINTGEALVRVGGGAVASGDVINTISGLQAAAPANEILVGETTYRATAAMIKYRAAAPVAVKGRAEPVPVWAAIEAGSGTARDLTSVGAPMVGRRRELNLLSDALARTKEDRSPQLVTIVGVPGIGKSRLVAELLRTVAQNPGETVTWRQGRSLSYGDGVTFWALGEMVKAQSGILETDPEPVAEEKLMRCVAELIPVHNDAQWIEGHLRALVGLGTESRPSSDRREETFTAWRGFFEALAEQQPLVLIFEDLHWADENLLDFIEHLIGWVSGVPLLVVGTARSELVERRSGWGGDARNATTFSLSPLSEEETARLISSLSGRPVMAAETQAALLARVGGNPLYAEQYVRLLAERGEDAELPLPDTVQGIIAARLDALSGDEKGLLQCAAVLGKVFWLGALTAVGGTDRLAAEQRLHALERKDFIQRARRSSVAEEVEYAFQHVLLRDVAYGQIPRGQRAEQHRLAAGWIASLGRPEDQAEMLAHHYGTAVDLCRAAGQEVEPALAERALASLRDAGDRAVSLNAYASAIHFYESALRLASTDSLDNAQLLFKLGRTQFLVGVYEPAHLVVACAKLLSCGDREAAAEAQAVLAEVNWWRGNRDEALSHMRRARELVADLNPSRSTAYVLSRVAGDLMLAGESADAISLASEAFATAEELGIDELRAHTMHTIGTSKISRGDAAGIMDLERSAAIAVQANAAPEICMAQGSLASSFWSLGQLTRSWGILEESEETASRFGLIRESRWIRGERIAAQWTLGLWREAMEGAETFLAEVEAGSPHYLAPSCYLVRAHIRLGRDDLHEALVDAERALELARVTKDPQSLYPALVACAHIFSECGNLERSGLLADECLVALRGGGGVGFWLACTHRLAWALSALGRRDELLKALPDLDLPWVHAARSHASGDVRRAADICATMGAATEEARDRLWLAHALVEQNRPNEADVELQRARAFYGSVEATHYLRECEGLLANSA